MLQSGSSEVMSWIASAVGALLGIAIVCMIAYALYAWVRNLTSAVRRVPARVVRKRHEQHDITWDSISPLDRYTMDDVWDAVSPGSGSDILLKQTADCYLTFEFNGRRQEFKVPQSLYPTPEGTEGLLVYQGQIFRHFIPGVTTGGASL